MQIVVDNVYACVYVGYMENTHMTNLDALKMPRYAKNGDLMHSENCSMKFGRKDAQCPRCIELMSGSAPRARFGGRQTFAQRDAQACKEIAAHFTSHKHLSGGCGPVCTFGEW